MLDIYRNQSINLHCKSVVWFHCVCYIGRDGLKCRSSTFNLILSIYLDKPDTTSGNKQQEHRKSINSEWYKQLQKGGEIPETGLASKITGRNITSLTLISNEFREFF